MQSDRKLALFDFDHVIYDGNSFYDLVRAMANKDIVPQLVVLESVKQAIRYRTGFTPYGKMSYDSLKFLAEALKGIEEEHIIHFVEAYLRDNPHKIREYVAPIFKMLRDTHDIYIVTASPHMTAAGAARILEPTGYYGSEFVVERGVFTGKIGRTLSYDERAKQEVVHELFERYPKEGSIACGDSENDLCMMSAVEFPVVFNPDKILKEHALENNWLITNENRAKEDLTQIISGAILYKTSRVVNTLYKG